jgi:DNA-binding CsgD family transcriptional regulator
VDLARAEGRFDDVRRIVDAVAADLGDEAVMPGWQILALGVRSAAESADRSRKRRRTVEVETAVAAAERWLDALRAIVERGRSEGGAGPWAEATLATAEAEMGHARGAPDPNAWPPVIDQWIELSHPYQSAVARFRLAGAALQRGGDRVVATDALRAAQSTASAIGAEPLQAEIAALAAAARIDASETPDVGTPDPDRANAIVLTAREGAVMALVAQGHTNREIGERLFISEKTVSVHVSNAMAKLGALSRYEAAAAAERLGLL